MNEEETTASFLNHEAEALLHFDEAMAAIPLEHKQDYLTAVEHDLVPTETDPLRYLKYAGFNAWDAAQRMCTYWQRRVFWFKERAFLPLRLENGALDMKDRLVLQSGYPVILPPTADGKPVILFDRSKLISNVDPVARNRAVWYGCHLMSLYDRAQEDEGVIFLVNLVQPRLPPVDQLFVTRSMWFLDNGIIPIKIKPHMLCSLPLTMSRNEKLTNNIIECISFYMRPTSGLCPDLHFYNHMGEGFLHALMGVGLKKEGIPTFAGGTWSFESVASWLNCQALRELKVDEQQRQRRLSGKTDAKSGALYQTREERKTKNAIHSRNKRERRKRELDQLKSEHEQLKEANELLKTEHACLERLWKKAKQFDLATEQLKLV